MKRVGILVVVAGAVVIASFVVSVEAYRFKKIEKNGPLVVSPVAATILATSNFVSAGVQNTLNSWDDFVVAGSASKFQNKFPPDDKWSRFYLFRKSDSFGNSFPSDDLILLDRGKDRFIRRYVAIPLNLRTSDFYLYEPTGDEYWPSEYRYRGQPAKFRCSFFIHVEPAAGASTRVEIFEYQPQIWVGERFGFSAHAALPTTFHDIRFVEPTTIDRLELLSLLLKSLVTQSQ